MLGDGPHFSLVTVQKAVALTLLNSGAITVTSYFCSATAWVQFEAPPHRSSNKTCMMYHGPSARWHGGCYFNVTAAVAELT
jgi:hypothetical protein